MEKERIDSLAAPLPNLDTYKTEVEVIVIVIDDEVEDNQNHTNHDGSSDEESINCSRGSKNDNDSPPTETTPAVSKQLFSSTNSSKNSKVLTQASIELTMRYYRHDSSILGFTTKRMRSRRAISFFGDCNRTCFYVEL